MNQQKKNREVPVQLVRLVRYSISGGTTMLLDFLILITLVEKIGLHYIAAAVTGFLVAHTLHYTINRKWAFRDTKTRLMKGYEYFMAFGIGNAFLLALLMSLLVGHFGIYYLLAKVICLTTLGVANFVLNYVITFGKGEEIKRIFFKEKV